MFMSSVLIMFFHTLSITLLILFGDYVTKPSSSSPRCADLGYLIVCLRRSRRLTVRTLGSHPNNRGSIPREITMS